MENPQRLSPRGRVKPEAKAGRKMLPRINYIDAGEDIVCAHVKA